MWCITYASGRDDLEMYVYHVYGHIIYIRFVKNGGEGRNQDPWKLIVYINSIDVGIR